MKAFLFSLVLISSPFVYANEDELRTPTFQSITLKRDVTLEAQPEPNSLSQMASVCYDFQTNSYVKEKFCLNMKGRRCEVIVYNFRRSPQVPNVAAGTVFRANKQFGPMITNDWGKTSAHFKVFSNVTGNDGDFSNPNLIISCSAPGGMWGFSLSGFSISEIANALSQVVEIK